MKDEGGPAFPQPMRGSEGEWVGDFGLGGMSLRDYFAAQAITGTNPGAQVSQRDVEEYAMWAYRMADAMLKERSK